MAGENASRDTVFQPVPFGDASSIVNSLGDLDKPIVAMAADPATGGYWLVGSDGGVFAFDAPFYGSMGGMHLDAPVVGIAAAAGGDGYWLVGSDGGVFSFGPGAHFHGSTGGVHLDKPIVAMAGDPATGGYWLVGSDGGVFAFDAPFYGSMGGMHLDAPVVGVAAAAGGDGYWLVGSDGGVFAFDAPFYGSMGGTHLDAPVVGVAAAAGGDGYWLVGSDGGVFSFGPGARFYGSDSGFTFFNPIVAISSTPSGKGYWLLPSWPPATPGVPVLGEPERGTFGYGHVEPCLINNNGDATSYLENITWTSWGGPTAIGTGTGTYVAPNQPTSQGAPEQATVVAYDLGTCRGIYMYQAVQWYFPQHGESFNPTGRHYDACSGGT